MIRETFISLTKLPEAKNKDFEFNTDKEEIVLNGDSTYLRRAIENLIANSIKHNPPYTTVKINIYTEVWQVVFKNVHGSLLQFAL